jgi:hypothetical protein
MSALCLLQLEGDISDQSRGRFDSGLSVPQVRHARAHRYACMFVPRCAWQDGEAAALKRNYGTYIYI